jgi:signal transduction histidine kinase/ligand-binding sensor domain-containing protein/AraC-like DNA-binding protein
MSPGLSHKPITFYVLSATKITEKMLIRLSITILIFILGNHSNAQTSPIKFRQLTTQDRLSRSWVKCIHQDQTGYLWVGTAEGLYKYDGISFRTYKYVSTDPNSLNHNNINIIFEDSKKNLWIGTQAGLNLYDRNNDEFISVKSINNYISSIYEFSNNIYLVGTAGGLFLFDPVDLSARQLYTDFYVTAFLKDRKNNFWMATNKGLMLLDTTNFTYRTLNIRKDLPGSNSQIILWSMIEDSKGGIWIGTSDDGLIYMSYDNPFEPVFTIFGHDPKNRESINEGAIYTISEDDKAILWVGVENGGVNLLDLNNFDTRQAKFVHLDDDPNNQISASNNSIHCIYKDRQNTMWIGTYNNGISYYNRLLIKFGHFKSQPGNNRTINDNHINVIYEEDAYLWIGTEGGLNVFDKENGSFRYYRNDPNNINSISANAVWSIYRDSRNNLWIGVWGGGVNLFNEKDNTFKRFLFDENDPTSIGGNNIYKIIEDREKDLWIASMRGGLNRYDAKTGKFQRFLEVFDSNSISCDWVNTVMESSDGDLWISTTEAVDLYNKNSDHFTTFIHDPANTKSISYNGAICFYEDSRKNIWIGTSNGLNLFIKKDSSFRCYQQSHGLPDNIIKAIIEDDHGNLWLSTNQGISKFINGTSAPQSPKFRNYNESDGLQANEFNSRVAFRNKEGLIYFGGNNGYNVFHPDKIEDNPNIPNIVFTNLLIYNKPVSVGEKDSPLKSDISVTKELKLTRKHGVFTIEFASLNLLAPENNQYAFILEGFEKNWNYPGHQRSVTYTNLDPGRYRFRVKASNNDGLWNEEGISLKITILPAWWQTLFARIIYMMLVFLGIYYFRKNTIISVNLKNELWRDHLEKQKSEELNLMKHQFFTNISHELRTPLTLILGPLKKLMSERNVSAQIELVYRNAQRLKTLVDQIMDFSKLENQMMKLTLSPAEVIELTSGVLRNFSDFAYQKNISVILRSTMSKCLVNIDEDKFEKVLTNIVSNGIKHTPGGGKIEVFIDYNNSSSELIIEISDTGKGISTDEIEHIFNRFYTSSDLQSAKGGSGIGLNLTKKLVELQKGKISVRSKETEGTCFSILIPVSLKDISYEHIEIYLTGTGIEDKPEPYPKSPQFRHENTILVIDDNTEMCDYIESVISEDYDVVKVYDPFAGINQVLRYLPDLIISDVMMPGLDGFQLCRLIKHDVRFSHIPVILLTARVNTQDHITGYETGADDYIYKPFDGAILRARIKNLITKKLLLKNEFIREDGTINKETEANPLDVSFIEKIMVLIRENYANADYSVNDIIDKMAMSRSIFYKKFKSLSDQSVNDIIKNIRLQKALEMMKTGKYKVNEVAYNSGFSDPAYFSRVFKEMYKLSPSEYIQSQNKNLG